MVSKDGYDDQASMFGLGQAIASASNPSPCFMVNSEGTYFASKPTATFCTKHVVVHLRLWCKGRA